MWGISHTHHLFAELLVNGKPVTFEVDTGVAVTVLSQEVYHQVFPNLKLQTSSMLLKAYTGSQVQVVGEAQVNVSYGEQKGKFTLYVVKGNGSCLLGRNWLKYIHLYRLEVNGFIGHERWTQLSRIAFKSTTWYSKRT